MLTPLTGLSLCVLLLNLIPGIQGACLADTQCFGNGDYNAATQTCSCYARQRTGQYTGECCESIGCISPNATCKHGYCDTDGEKCARCMTGWTGPNCENVTSCFPWFPCRYHGSCKKSRSRCDCEPGWVGDLCDRSLCQVPCKYGACPNDPKKCECYDNYYGTECERSYCAAGWECLNGGYCVDLHHCVCPPNYSGEHCETISECSVPCEHGRCTHKPDVCECETNWGPPGNCSIYEGPCLNCSSEGGTCKDGPNTCKCKPGYMGPQCSEKTCDGCVHGRCHLAPLGKSCGCDAGWANQVHVPGFDPLHGPCTIIRYCMVPCVHGACPHDPYRCECSSPQYVGTECDTIRCPKCCPPETCNCSNLANIHCRPTWHHDCCLLKSCFRGDTLVHTARGMVPIETIKEGDMVVTRHEGDDSSVTYLRRVDQVRKQFVPKIDLVVFSTHEEDIWVTRDHPFFETVTGKWMSAVNVTTSHSLQGLNGKMVRLKNRLKASQLLTSADESGLVAVYDLSVDEYDRYAVGKDGLLVSACNNSNDLEHRDKQVWGEAAHPNFVSSSVGGTQTFEVAKEELNLNDDRSDTGNSGEVGPTVAIVIGSVLAALCLVVALFLIIKYRGHKKRRTELQPLVAQS